ncbi:MAG: sugar-transfer associated ATP-grasp domain-containing protein [Pseudomonadota bacterium]
MPGKSWEEKSRFVCLYGSPYFPWAKNAKRYNLIFNHKYIEKNFLIGAGLPTPALLAAIGKDYDIKDENQLYDFLTARSEPIVIKPIGASKGSDVMVLRPQGDVFHLGTDTLTKEQIWKRLTRRSGDGWIAEKYVECVGLAKRMHPASLNSFRVMTVQLQNGEWCLLDCVLKSGRDDNIVDNALSDSGLKIWLDSDGRIDHVWDYQTDSSITSHPSTGVKLVGELVEGYQEVVDLALRASSKLGFAGSIGFDIAYTADGPVILEGNASWSCRFQRWDRGLITDEIAPQMNRRNIFSTWDKRCMHPDSLYTKWFK